MSQSFPLLERDAEVAEVARLQTQAAAGHGALLLVGGEAGIGKTALIDAVAAGLNGAAAVTGHCPGPGETPLYGPLLQVVRRLTVACGIDSGSLPPPFGTAAGTWTAYALAGALATWLGSAGRPLLVALEDLHWADTATLEVLRHLPGHLADVPVLAVATYRTDEIHRSHPLWTLLPHLQRAGTARILLRRFTPEAVVHLTASALGPRPNQEDLARRLYQRTGGLPLFVREMLENWSHSSDLEDSVLPETVQQVIDSLLAKLSPGTQEVMQAAAVLGEHFDWALLARTADLSENGLADALEEAVACHIIRPVGAQGQSFRFDHALVREALLGRLIGPRRQQWHRRVAEALLAAPVPEVETLAYHLSQAGDDRAAGYVIQSGERAYQVGALTQAERYFNQALALMDPADCRRPELLLRQALIVIDADGKEYGERLEAAHQAAEAAGDVFVSHCTRKLLLPRQSTSMPLTENLAALEVLEREEQAILDGPDRTRLVSLGRLMLVPVSRAQRLAFGARTEEARALITELRGRSLDPFNAAALVAADYFLAIQTGEFDRAIALLNPLVQERLEGPDAVYGVLRKYLQLYVMALSQADRPAELEQAVADGQALEREVLKRSGYSVLPGGYSLAGMYHFLRGDWEQAQHDVIGGLAASGGDRPGVVRQTAAAMLLALGQPAEALSALASLPPTRPGVDLTIFDHPTPFIIFALRAEAHLRLGDVDRARTWVETGERWLSQGDFRAGRSTVLLARASLSRYTGDLAAARNAAAEAVALAAEIHHLWDLISGQRLLGELEAALGRPAEAGQPLLASLDLAERCRFAYEAALTKLAWGRALPNAPGVRELLQAARDTFARLGATPALVETDALLAKLARPGAIPEEVSPDRLTDREIEIARLVAQGLSDKEVGARLFISPRTVDGHLRNIYSKLGINSRSALTVWAIHHRV